MSIRLYNVHPSLQCPSVFTMSIRLYNVHPSLQCPSVFTMPIRLYTPYHMGLVLSPENEIFQVANKCCGHLCLG